MTKELLLDRLPPYIDKWIKIKENQNVEDIVSDVLDKHKRFAPYYDKIALFFDRRSINATCEALYKFCKEDIQYYEEPKEMQTTALPTGILTRGYGDCKHYASFCGGCLDAINRLTGKKIDWCYRFASYNPDPRKKKPHHVFVVVYDDKGGELWIDPTPAANQMTPFWILDKEIKVKRGTMALYSNIGSLGTHSTNSVGLIPEAISFAKDIGELFGSLINALGIGDQVPGYPIRSRKNWESIIANLTANFPQPTSITQANVLWEKARQWKAEADRKVQEESAGKTTNQTYSMLLTDIMNVYQRFGATTIPNNVPLPAGENKFPGTSKSDAGTWLLSAGLAAAPFVAFKTLGTGKISRVGKAKKSNSNTGIVATVSIAALAVGIFSSAKKKGPVQQTVLPEPIQTQKNGGASFLPKGAITPLNDYDDSYYNYKAIV